MGLGSRGISTSTGWNGIWAGGRKREELPGGSSQFAGPSGYSSEGRWLFYLQG